MKRPIKSASNLRDIAALAVFAALMVVLKEILAFLPNIEVVTLLVILCTVFFGWKTLLPVTVFTLIEGMIYGIHYWWFAYLYIWPLLVAIVMLLRRWSHPMLWTIVAGFFGLLFGPLSAIPYFITGGLGAGFGYIVSGIPFDLAHTFGNILSVALLYYPLEKIMKKIFCT